MACANEGHEQEKSCVLQPETKRGTRAGGFWGESGEAKRICSRVWLVK